MITKMKKILLAGKVEDREKVLMTLRSTKSVHVDAAVPETIRIPEVLSKEYEDCEQALSILSQVADENDIDCLATPGTPTRLVEETLAHYKAVTELKSKSAAMEVEMEGLRDWGGVGLKDLEIIKKEGINYRCLIGSKKYIEEIEAEAVEVVKPHSFSYLILAFSRNEIKWSERYTEISMPKREYPQLFDEINMVNKALQDNEHALVCLKQRYEDVEAYFKKLGNKKRFKEVETGVFCEDSLFVLTGWCPEAVTETLEKSFSEAGLAVGIDFSDPEEGDYPPTKLDNKAYASSIEPLLKFMGMIPSYNEPDISFYFLSALIIFASFILADLGYGLLIALPLVFSYKKLIEKGADEKLLRFLLFIGFGTAIYGFITNSFFGFQPFGFGFDPGTPESSGGDMILWQKLCLFIGAIHLTLAHVKKMLIKPKNLCMIGELGWLVFLWAMYGLLCPLVGGSDLGVFKYSNEFTLFGYTQKLYLWMFELSAVMILFFTNPSTNPIKMLMSGLGAIASNASGMFSDILSYIRLWAVGLAGGKVAGAFNDIGSMAASIPMLGFALQVLIFICGHLLNIILSCVSVLAHAVRLNLLEFSNHLGLEWAGREYDPFKEK